jgi:hypothetical protein
MGGKAEGGWLREGGWLSLVRDGSQSRRRVAQRGKGGLAK